jgi:hypothetical protein
VSAGNEFHLSRQKTRFRFSLKMLLKLSARTHAPQLSTQYIKYSGSTFPGVFTQYYCKTFISKKEHINIIFIGASFHKRLSKNTLFYVPNCLSVKRYYRLVLINILADYGQRIIIVIMQIALSLLYQSCILYHSVFVLHCFTMRGCLLFRPGSSVFLMKNKIVPGCVS